MPVCYKGGGSSFIADDVIFSFSLFSYLWPPTLTRDPAEILLQFPLRYRMTPLGVQKGVRLCARGSAVGERDSGDYLGRCSLLVCHL